MTQLGKWDVSELTDSERSAIKDAAAKGAHAERAKAVGMATLSVFISLVALPVLAAIAFFGGSAAVLSTPDSLFYPIALAVLGGGGFAAWKIVEGSVNLFRSSVLPHWDQSRQLDILSAAL